MVVMDLLAVAFFVALVWLFAQKPDNTSSA